MKVIAETMLTKHYLIFRLEDNSNLKIENIRTGSIFSVEGDYYMKEEMEPLLKVVDWLHRYKMEELRERVMERFFLTDLGLQALRFVGETALAEEVARRLEEKKAREQERREKQLPEKQRQETPRQNAPRKETPPPPAAQPPSPAEQTPLPARQTPPPDRKKQAVATEPPPSAKQASPSAGSPVSGVRG